jgi:predicted dehydrogenase
MLFNSEPSRIESAIIRHPQFGTDVVTTALLDFGTGHATFTASTLAEDGQEVRILGERGRIVIPIPFNIPPGHTTRVHLYQGGDPPAAPHVQTYEFDALDPYTAEAEAFAAAVLGGEPVPTPPSDGVANMKVIEAILSASHS